MTLQVGESQNSGGTVDAPSLELYCAKDRIVVDPDDCSADRPGTVDGSSPPLRFGWGNIAVRL